MTTAEVSEIYIARLPMPMIWLSPFEACCSSHRVTYSGRSIFGETSMKEIEFEVPRNCDLSSAAQLIEAVCSRQGLRVAMKGSLSTYPGCVHWHYKNQDQKGTLELTLYVPDKRIWAKIQEGRKAPWIDTALPPLQRAIEHHLRSTCKSVRSAQPRRDGARRRAKA
jgi:hypothetical protein